MEGNRERKRAGIWKGIGRGKGQVCIWKRACIWKEGNREGKKAGIWKGIERGKGQVYGSGGGGGGE